MVYQLVLTMTVHAAAAPLQNGLGIHSLLKRDSDDDEEEVDFEPLYLIAPFLLMMAGLVACGARYIKRMICKRRAERAHKASPPCSTLPLVTGRAGNALLFNNIQHREQYATGELGQWTPGSHSQHRRPSRSREPRNCSRGSYSKVAEVEKEETQMQAVASSPSSPEKTPWYQLLTFKSQRKSRHSKLVPDGVAPEGCDRAKADIPGLPSLAYQRTITGLGLSVELPVHQTAAAFNGSISSKSSITNKPCPSLQPEMVASRFKSLDLETGPETTKSAPNTGKSLEERHQQSLTQANHATSLRKTVYQSLGRSRPRVGERLGEHDNSQQNKLGQCDGGYDAPSRSSQRQACSPPDSPPMPFSLSASEVATPTTELRGFDFSIGFCTPTKSPGSPTRPKRMRSCHMELKDAVRPKSVNIVDPENGIHPQHATVRKVADDETATEWGGVDCPSPTKVLKTSTSAETPTRPGTSATRPSLKRSIDRVTAKFVAEIRSPSTKSIRSPTGGRPAPSDVLRAGQKHTVSPPAAQLTTLRASTQRLRDGNFKLTRPLGRTLTDQPTPISPIKPCGCVEARVGQGPKQEASNEGYLS